MRILFTGILLFVISTTYSQNKTAPHIEMDNHENMEQETLPVMHIYTITEHMPMPKYDLKLYFKRNMVAPDIVSENELKGKVIVQFVVNEDGSISDSKVVKGMCKECDYEALLLISNMPRWEPGKQGNEYVKVYWTEVVNFNGSTRILSYADTMPRPTFDLNKYIGTNLHYPEKARQQNISGRVIVNFIVNTDGNISDAQVVRGIGAGCDEEALRIVNSMPKWSAGMQGDKKVKVYITLPISFVIF